MVSIPKVLSNKTIFTGLSQSALKGMSPFKPVPSAADKMGKVVAATPVKLGKMGPFMASSSAKVSSMPTGLGQPGFVPKHMISFR